MFLSELVQPVTVLKGAGPAAAAHLARLGITTVADLLRHYPREWEDRSRRVPMKDWNSSAVCTDVTVLAHDWIFGRARTKTLKIYVEDETARACLICFNQPWLQRQLPPGTRCRLYGNFSYKYGDIQSTDFEIEPLSAHGAPSAEGGFVAAGILPVYPLTEGLHQKSLRKLTRLALDAFAPSLQNELPDSIIARDRLLSKSAAITAVHFPASQGELAQAKQTLIYEELFFLEVMVGRRAMARKRGTGHDVQRVSPALNTLQQNLLNRLPFSITSGQAAAVAEINADMDSPYPMARLLQGDVGSGKTLVSFLAALKAVQGGGQAALLAPTELLARQHAESAAALLEPLGVRIAFLTGNMKTAGRQQLLSALAAGEIDIAAGTHALFSQDVTYRNLRLVIVDEQHRFGVIQRQAIMDKGDTPDLLMMSATPIPRSLAMTVFGDLDISVIRDLPPGRKTIKTHLKMQSNVHDVYDFVRGELAAGHQAYFVYPLIEAGDDDTDVADTDARANSFGLKDAVSMSRHLAQNVFPGFPLALLHSKVDDDEKRHTMEAFRRGEIKILAATSVVEVGVDVPNANCMVIEHAERFGLAALHQMRGRVGRGHAQSYCFLVYASPLTDDGKTRLNVMRETSDGFVIAEEDLKLRGPGQVAGVEQSGYFALGLADPVRDAEELARARADAFAMLEANPHFDHPANLLSADN